MVVSAPCEAQSSLPEQLEIIELTEPLHASLALLQGYWLEWLTAYHQRDRERAERLLDDIFTTMGELDVERLPDLSYGASLSAVQAARASDFGRASWALAAAERLDPGRPETAFAAATVARLEGRRLAALWQQLAGYLRLLRFPWEREILVQGALLWGLFSLVLSSALFVVLLASTKGARFYRDLVRLLTRRLPATAAKVTAAVILVLPLALPEGLLWLLLFWTIVFWGYSSRTERVVLVTVWLLLALVPEVVTRQRRHMAVMLSSPMRALENLALSRLEGSMLTDLGELRALLPESVAVKHLLADVHQRMGQRDFARSLYLDVIDAEPDNACAMVNLGAFYFHVADYTSAIQHFQRASGDDSVAALANFNLSQSYSASYLFAQSEEALRAARRLDEDGVSRWMKEASGERIITVDGGVERIDEIRRELRSAWNVIEAPVPFWRSVLDAASVGLVTIVAVLAVALEVVGRRKGFYAHRRRSSGRDAGDDEADRDDARSLVATLIPGAAAARRAEGLRAFGSLLPPVALLTLPLVTLLGYRIPWGFDPGSSVMWTVAVAGLLAYATSRVVRGLRA